MNTSKLVGFIQGVLYPVLFLIMNYVIANLGGSGLVSASTAGIITGILSIVENTIQKNTGSALFGLASSQPNYTQD